MVHHLEKEQAEQQQYADQVVNQLGHALRALEADNASLQEDRRLNEQKLNIASEARRKLERTVRQVKAENEAIVQKEHLDRRPGEKKRLFSDEATPTPRVIQEVLDLGPVEVFADNDAAPTRVAWSPLEGTPASQSFASPEKAIGEDRLMFSATSEEAVAASNSATPSGSATPTVNAAPFTFDHPSISIGRTELSVP